MNNPPDIYLENFWNSFFKKSIINYCNELSQVITNISNNKYFDIPITSWCNELNKLQNEKKYDIIEVNIYNHIISYGWYLLQAGKIKHCDYNFHSQDIRHCDFYLTNIKRWNKISKHKINYKCEIYNYFKIYKYFIEKQNYDILNFIKNKDIKYITDYAIYHNYDNILDYCIKIDGIYDYIKNNHMNNKLNISSNNYYKFIPCAKKILKKIK
jgi:hypothetical protein